MYIVRNEEWTGGSTRNLSRSSRHTLGQTIVHSRTTHAYFKEQLRQVQQLYFDNQVSQIKQILYNQDNKVYKLAKLFRHVSSPVSYPGVTILPKVHQPHSIGLSLFTIIGLKRRLSRLWLLINTLSPLLYWGRGKAVHLTLIVLF